jgi:hypothetical protein
VVASVKLNPAEAHKVHVFEFVVTPQSKPEAAMVQKTEFYAKEGL